MNLAPTAKYILACIALTAVGAQAADLGGRRISEVLDELRAQNLTLIYSSEMVPPTLRVLVEPTERQGFEMAREILAPHGLSLSPVAPGVYAVVKDSVIASAPPRFRSTTLDEVVVHSSRYALAAEGSAAHTFLTQDEVRNMPRLADETLRAVQRLPGVATNGFSSLGSIRGGEQNEIAIVLDGLRLYEPFHLKNFLSPVSLLDSRIVAGMDVYAGGYPVMYGNRTSAIIDARSAHPLTDASVTPGQARYYEAGLSLFHLNALAAAEFADRRVEALLAVRRSNAGDLAQFSETEFGKPHYSDGFGRIDFRISDATRAALNFLLSTDRIDALKDSGAQRARAEYESSYVWATLQHQWADNADSRLIVSYTDITNEREGQLFDPGRRAGRVDDTRSFHVVGLQLDTHLGSTWAGREIEHRFGGEVRQLWAHYAYASEIRYEPGYPFPDSPAFEARRASAPQPQGFESALYWDGRMQWGKRFTAEAGLRFDQQTYDASDDAAQWSPRVGVLYDVGVATRLRASWGRFFQPQSINELQVEDGRDRFYAAEQADHSIVSIEQRFAFALDLRIEVYRKDYRRINPRYENQFDPLVLLPELEFDRVAIAPHSARAEGVEALLRFKPPSAWSGWLGYTWSRVRDHVADRDIPRTWDQQHAATLGLVWAKGPWSIAVTDTFHTGWPTTTLSVTATTPQRVVVGERNGQRLGNYNSLDARIARSFAFTRGVLEVYAEASNLTARDNPCCVQYSAGQDPDGSLRVREDVNNWLPLVPSAGVLWRY